MQDTKDGLNLEFLERLGVVSCTFYSAVKYMIFGRLFRRAILPLFKVKRTQIHAVIAEKYTKRTLFLTTFKPLHLSTFILVNKTSHFKPKCSNSITFLSPMATEVANQSHSHQLSRLNHQQPNLLNTQPPVSTDSKAVCDEVIDMITWMARDLKGI